MVEQVWKFPLRPGEQHLDMPAEAILLHVGTQMVNGYERHRMANYEDGFLWALVDTDAPVTKRGIAVHGTGHDVYPGGRYVGTFKLGSLVWHVFDHGDDPTGPHAARRP